MPHIAKNLLIASGVFCAACSGDSPPADRGPRMALEPFSEFFEVVETVVLQPGPHPIVRVSGLDRDSRGRFVMADRSEAMVYLFDPRGALIRAFGGHGGGPGEFYSPHSPRFGPDGRIHVPDTRTATVSVFDSLGNYQRNVSTRQLVVVSSIEVLSDGTYLLLGQRLRDARHLVFTMDSTGQVRESLVPLSDRRPTGAKNSPAWGHVRRPSVARRGDTLTVVLSTSDSVWHIAQGGHGPPAAEHLPVDGYTPPRLPPGGPMDIQKVRAWGRSFSTVADVLSTDSSIAIPVVRGVLYEGDSAVVAFRQPDGAWVNLTNAPVLLRAAGGLYVGTPNPVADTITLVLYRRKR